MIERGRRALPHLPEGYECRVAGGEADCAAIASLITEDSGFGVWTAERVKAELFDRQVGPGAGLMMLFKEKLVGCGFVVDASTRRKRIAHGMYLYIVPAYRGVKSISHTIIYRAFGAAIDLGYDKMIATTDTWRFPALFLYLSIGCVPVKNSLFSYMQWSRIDRRLRPTLMALAKRQARMALAE